jgi:hypothetical protein
MTGKIVMAYIKMNLKYNKDIRNARLPFNLRKYGFNFNKGLKIEFL